MATSDLAFPEDYQGLGFAEYPFSPAADPRYFYVATPYRAILNELQKVVGRRLGLAVVEGDAGLGKSTMARRLYDIYVSAGDQYLPLYLHTTKYKSSHAVFTKICDSYKVPRARSEAAQREKFERWLVERRAAHQVPIIIVDDAQLMAPDALEAFQYIYNFDVKQKLTQVILFGQTELRERLTQNKALLSRAAGYYVLNSLTLREALAMVNFRCTVAERHEPFFTELAFVRLHEFAGGVPRTIVLACGILINVLSAKGRYTADEEAVDEAIARYSARPDIQPDTPLPPPVLPKVAPSARANTRRKRSG